MKAPIIVIILTMLALPLLAEAASKPNVVILYADDMGVADVSYGNSEAKTQ